MSSFTRSVVRIARNIRASEQNKKTVDEQKSRIIFQKIRFVLDKLANPSETSGCKYTDQKYIKQRVNNKKTDWHHVTGIFNRQPSSTLKYKLQILDRIVDKLTNNTYSFHEIYQGNDFSSQQIQLIDQLINCKQTNSGIHINQHKRIKNTQFDSWQDTIISALSFNNIRDFFQVIKQALLSFEISNNQIHNMKQDFVNYLLKWGKPHSRVRNSKILTRIAEIVRRVNPHQ